MDRSREQPAPDGTAAVVELPELLEFLLERPREVSSHPLSAAQLRAVVALAHHGGMNLRTLADVLGSTPPLVSRLCDRLEAVGFLERLPSARSRRELTLRLSDRGRAYLEDLRRRRRESVQPVLARMTAAGLGALAAGLREYHAIVAAERDADGSA
ncbi:MarR family transcriptional regulator [Amycolatopsis sp. NBC_01488]|uniref:MarR family transcriptional regulator n=1 Tax=Amycolatopsis sp. NBC_01488 TaxID=2903563 RepID=UPI002E27B09D|nr:MarR family transcriptional regulator [Amycolatopsis sp. NBC_01488]